MSTKFNLVDYDVVYLSYDEPNAEANYTDLLTKIPNVKRIHGVRGSDAAHKACASICTTERIIIVDGDNIIDGDFFNQIIEIEDEIDASKTVFSWPAKNVINGLIYGNGGIKCWPRSAILSMRTHENAATHDTLNQVDFCWALNYMAIDRIYSETHNNTSALQAWRAGFREGVKMSLDRGSKVDNLTLLDKSNLNRLMIWMTVGADVDNGVWAILGARQGCHKTHFTDWDHTQVRDFEYLNQLYFLSVSKLTINDALSEIDRLGLEVSKQLPLSRAFDPAQSRFFKNFNFNPDRQPKTLTIHDQGYDIVMITYEEANAEKNWAALKARFPRSRRVHGVKGIHQAHKTAAGLVRTRMFWVVDGDADIVSNFNFDYIVPNSMSDWVHVWRSKNPVNGLVYGYGGVKLLPTSLTLNMDMSKPDMTTSISNKYKPVFDLSNITVFNTDAFSAWRSGFRECCKLASKIIDRQNDEETMNRLEVWCSVGKEKPYGSETILGAKAGRLYGEQHRGDISSLSKINDFSWLMNRFNEQ